MTKRNYGIDLLRIVSMYMIVLNHVLLIGGVIGQATQLGTGTFNYKLSWLLDIICYGAVNCYALISGYVGVTSRYKPQNIIRLWLQVLFYSVVLNVAVVALVPGLKLSKEDILAMFMPISYQRYWYFSAYFVLFLFIPLLNYLLNTLSRASLQKMLFMLIMIFSFGETFIFRVKDFLALNSGYSALWLLVLYLIGDYIRLYDWNLWHADRLVFSGLVLLSFICFLAFGGEAGHGRVLVNYPAPTILLMAIALLAYFKDLKLDPRSIKWIKGFAPLTFGVYLIHLQPMVAVHLIQGRFSSLAKEAPLILLVDVVGGSLLIYLGCSLLEKLRQVLFSLLRIELLVQKLEALLLRVVHLGTRRL
ncbi:acyltransferase family protein [Ligilactobacillus apodemi]|uniref:acyltransferase family protein n=1 Tax=Ligilactobacillus apodemi TaxID=307126 RepID=UPI00214C8DBC|nr:acyltransferase family protein [Ligilactobacillus apodemi]MCR1901984.1 acyltransferase family protein [Ligilactobacillus apodemi]